MQIEQREINNYSGNSPDYYEFSSIEDDYEMELDVDLDCQEDIEYLEFETLVQGFSEAQIKTEEERLHFELENLVQRIFEIISKWMDYYNRHKSRMIKQTILTYKSKYFSEYYKQHLVRKFKQILFEISYIKKPEDRRDNNLYISSTLVVLRTINYIISVFEMGFFTEEQQEEIAKKIIECF